MWWILIGMLAFLAVKNHFDFQGVKKDVLKIARGIRKMVRELVRTVRQAVKEAKQETAEKKAAEEIKAAAEGLKVVSEEKKAAAERETPAAQAEVKAPDVSALLQEAEQEPRTLAALLADVPVLDFPEDDPKYDSSRKYRTA